VVGMADIQSMSVGDFREWLDASSTYKLNHTQPRPYLADIVAFCARRGQFTIEYKTAFDGPAVTCDFIGKKFLNEGLPPSARIYLHRFNIEQGVF